MKKHIAWMIVLALTLTLTGCYADRPVYGPDGNRENAGVNSQTDTYELTGDIHSLDVRVGAAAFTIEYTDRFLVESNLNNLYVAEKDGVLIIENKALPGVNYEGAMLRLCLPAQAEFRRVQIVTGAARLETTHLIADDLALKLGAGDVEFGRLTVRNEADIEGGAGKITVLDGSIAELELEMGMGELNFTAALTGESDIKLGVGNADITLLGSRADYTLDIEKGLGSVSIDETTVLESHHSGNGTNRVEIEGGIGNIRIVFQEA